MPTLDHLNLSPGNLRASAQDMVVALAGNSCAWRKHNGWRTSRPGKDFQLRTGEGLINRQLAVLQYGKGAPRLVLTAAGEQMATAIKAMRHARANRKSRSTACQSRTT